MLGGDGTLVVARGWGDLATINYKCSPSLLLPFTSCLLASSNYAILPLVATQAPRQTPYHPPLSPDHPTTKKEVSQPFSSRAEFQRLAPLGTYEDSHQIQKLSPKHHSACHTFTVESPETKREPEAMREPSGDHASILTEWEWPP